MDSKKYAILFGSENPNEVSNDKLFKSITAFNAINPLDKRNNSTNSSSTELAIQEFSKKVFENESENIQLTTQLKTYLAQSLSETEHFCFLKRCLKCYFFYQDKCIANNTNYKPIESSGPWNHHNTFSSNSIYCPIIYFQKSHQCVSNGIQVLGTEVSQVASRSLAHPAYKLSTKRLCCSFCWNLEKTRCEKSLKPVPDRDSDGPWSSHSIVVNGVVTCPLLWFSFCKICKATGDHSHTSKNCPKRNSINNSNGKL